jgi:hypothetical protein
MEASIPVSILFFVVVVSVVHFGAHAMIVDPVDVHLCRHWRNNQNTNPTPGGFQERIYRYYNAARQAMDTPEEPLKHCWICEADVAVHSMHCKFCNKCVYHFDHHCMWLNTCIGEANYWSFFYTMISLMAMEAVHLPPQIYLVVDILLNGKSDTRANDYVGTVLILVFLFLFIAFNIVSLLSIGQLIFFHLNLQKKGLSTYEFIVQDNRNKRELARRQGDLERKRIMLIAKAEQDHQRCTAGKLQLGGMCRQIGCSILDPLDIPEPPAEPDPNAGFAAALGTGQPSIGGPVNKSGNRDMENGNVSHYHADNVVENKEADVMFEQTPGPSDYANRNAAAEKAPDTLSDNTDSSVDEEDQRRVISNETIQEINFKVHGPIPVGNETSEENVREESN